MWLNGSIPEVAPTFIKEGSVEQPNHHRPA